MSGEIIYPCNGSILIFSAYAFNRFTLIYDYMYVIMFYVIDAEWRIYAWVK